jgi:hypothetical protein
MMVTHHLERGIPERCNIAVFLQCINELGLNVTIR